MIRIDIRDDRGEVLAFVGTRDEFTIQQDAARAIGIYEHDRLGWIDWVEASSPGKGLGTALMNDALLRIESEGVSLIGLEVVTKDPADMDRGRRFYERLGFVPIPALASYSTFPIMVRDASWNGIET